MEGFKRLLEGLSGYNLYRVILLDHYSDRWVFLKKKSNLLKAHKPREMKAVSLT